MAQKHILNLGKPDLLVSTLASILLEIHEVNDITFIESFVREHPSLGKVSLYSWYPVLTSMDSTALLHTNNHICSVLGQNQSS